jgi:hypothetical protein
MIEVDRWVVTTAVLLVDSMAGLRVVERAAW